MHEHNKDIIKTNMPTKIKILWILSLFLGFLAGLFAGLSYDRIHMEKDGTEIMRIKGYKFIRPLLDYENSPELRDRETEVLKDEIERYIEDKIDKNEAIYVSVYFRDMLNGPWFGINEKDNFAPASLLKVPLMIAYLKCAEQNPEILNRTLVYDKPIEETIVRQNIVPDRELESGKSYSIEDLICRMIEYSDNRANNLLLTYIDKNILDKVYSDLGITIPNVRDKGDFITTKTYSSFFRILFNASYLNNEMSEKALKILSKSTFKIGIVAGVPSDVTVAHKFAERGNEENETYQLHDCGIVYYKDRPYLLCVMTYGRDFKALSEIIKDISSIVYKNIDDYYNKNHK